MSKLYKGEINFSVGIKQSGAVPLDDRTVVANFNDLLSADTFGLGAYAGMLVAVLETQQVYMLVDKANSTAVESWVAVGGLSEEDIENIGKIKDIENELNKIDEIEKTVTGYTETIESIQETLEKMSDNDTKNTAGSSESADKLYLIGAKEQVGSGTTTYSNSKIYVNGGKLYVEGNNVLVSNDITGLTESIDSLNESINDLNDVVTGHTYNIGQLEQVVSAHTQTLSSVENTITGYTETIERLEDIVSANTQTLSSVENTMSGITESINDLNNVVTGNTQEIETIKQHLSSTVDYGKALEISGSTVNVLVAEDNNYLKINEENELIVSEMKTNDTIFSETITIEGGPLAELAKQAYTGGTVPQGTSIQEFFKNLLCSEMYPSTSKNTPSYSISIDAPSISSNVSSGSLQEIGTKVNFNAVTAKIVSESKTEPKVSGFKYGYSDTINGTIVGGPTSVTTTISSSQKSGEVYKLTGTKSGFEGTVQASASNASYSSCTLSATTLTVALGSNSYSVSETAPKYTYSYSGIDSKYIVSNLGNRSEDNKSEAVAAKSATDSNQPTTSSTFTVTGVYPVYTNAVSSTAANTTAIEKRCTLSSGKTFEIDFGPETSAFNAFAYPATHSLSTTEIYNEDARKYEEYIGGSETIDATYTVQGTAIPYKVWKRKGSAYGQTTKFRFILYKNLNTK